LRFSLLTDFADAPRESMPEDAEYIDIVARGIEELNRRHGAGRFFLSHRGRSWSESEQRWIGWERKRGKLEQLNRFLIGESAPELKGFLCAGDRAQLEGIRFVITLDADTQLLRDTARRLVETLAHPLNQARLSPDGRRVIRGYWQIIDWLKPHVPLGGGGVEPNPLSPFNRWKIFDNLRRSLVPPATVALLLAGWFFTPAPLLWSGIIAGLMLSPVLNALLA